MKNYCFDQIKKRILEWWQQYILNGNNFIELEKNENNVLIFDLTFDNCLAQIIVNDEYFVPYKNVSFEAVTMGSEKAIANGYPELIYFFYDSEDMTEDEVVNQLNEGIRFCLNYIPNDLRKKYINKTGTLDVENEKMIEGIYPAGLEKVKEEFWEKEFVCTDTHCQYLVIENNGVRIMVLPKIFKVSLPR